VIYHLTFFLPSDFFFIFVFFLEPKMSSKDKSSKTKKDKEGKSSKKTKGEGGVPTDEMSKLKVKDKDERKAAANKSNRGDSSSSDDSDDASPGGATGGASGAAQAQSGATVGSVSNAASMAQLPTGSALGGATAAAGGAAAAAAGGGGSPPGAGVQHGVDKDTIIQANGVSYRPLQVVGTGSFGVVIQAQVVETQELVAIKKVLQDKRFKVRFALLSSSFFFFFFFF
jgi:hypothetical protein